MGLFGLVLLLAVQACGADAESPSSAFKHAHVLASSTPSMQGMTIKDFRQAYNVPLTPQGYPVTKTFLVVAYHYANAPSDYEQFCSKFALACSPLTIVNLAGNANNKNWAIEEMADIEMVRIANDNTQITVIEAASDSRADMMAALKYANSQAGDAVVSMSFGADEYATESVSAGFFQSEGITWIAASGDSTVPSFPATHPDVVAVGGTSLTSLASPRTEQTETAWSSGGCGFSALEVAPSFQIAAGVNDTARRAVPDVAFEADPAYGAQIYCSVVGGWLKVGGTSISAPFFAGIVSLANGARKLNAKPPLTSVAGRGAQLQPMLYELLSTNGGPERSTILHDIVSGRGCASNSPAARGYDVVTGLGSVDVKALIAYLANK